MDVRRFEELLDLRGDDLAAWPLDERTEALELVLTSPAASACLDAARRLRAAFAEPVPPAPAGLTDRIFAKAFALPRRHAAR
ncbi:hypothetical protein [Prosthecomicrobium hirschii]|uniref:Uncharacterized protein n=1 Tax=Prosthecodimorpha hirschii TaxID=665126 RepID=A0A0P6VP29_9HYPH|nr:hypothetical protein [Prosthecomicrobium hirschii]KPL53594.1 hypothetical protein ABB55_16380 [Prosthecomicrobium hirschii]MCW1842695.1 hypothetical protein [Prosthecomicrobium hirschii]